MKRNDIASLKLIFAVCFICFRKARISNAVWFHDRQWNGEWSFDTDLHTTMRFATIFLPSRFVSSPFESGDAREKSWNIQDLFLCCASDLNLQTKRDYIRNRSVIIIAVVGANLSEKKLLASRRPTPLSFSGNPDIIPKLYLEWYFREAVLIPSLSFLRLGRIYLF